jgi:hypothetical protein
VAAEVINPTQYGLPWSLLRFFPPASAIGAGQIDATTSSWLCAWDLDIKGQRKLHQLGEKYFFCMQNTGVDTINYSMFTRTLIMLP